MIVTTIKSSMREKPCERFFISVPPGLAPRCLGARPGVAFSDPISGADVFVPNILAIDVPSENFHRPNRYCVINRLF
jgi:hypothetical protein